MKSILLICSLFFAAAVVRGDFDEDEKKIYEAIKDEMEHCGEGLGVPISMEGVPRSAMSPEDAGKMDCIYACVMKQRGIIDGGQIIAEKMTEFITQVLPEKATELAKGVESCIEEAKGIDDECAMVGKFGMCLEKM